MESKRKSSRTNVFMLLIILSSLIISQSSWSQSFFYIKGHVDNRENQPLACVNVVAKESKTIAVADNNGDYLIRVTSNDTYLVFSLSGYVSKHIEIRNRKVIDVEMLRVGEPVLEGVTVVEDIIVHTGTLYIAQRELACASSKVKRRMFKGNRSNKQQSFAVSPIAYHQQYNTEGYSTIHENSFKEVTQEPLSTFSVDVDKASYSNIRRFLNSGQLPPKDAVRVEEMINYFSYDYPQPKHGDPFSVNKEMATCPWNEEHYLLKVGLKGKEIDKDKLPPSNLVFLLDVSGSMNSQNKLPLLKSAFSLLTNQLRPQDRVAIVVYAGAAGVVLESTPGNQKQKILASLNQLQAGGSTAGGQGLMLAYKIAEENMIEEGNNRIILATDGDFNVGASSNAEMGRMIEKERDKGVFMTVLGFGMGNYKDDKMEIIADKGNGNYAYIDNLQEAQKTLVSEFGGTLFTIAKDVKFQIEFNPSKIAAYRLIGYENRLLNNEDFNDDKKDAGEIGAGHTVTALYEIIPTGAKDANSYIDKVDPLKYQSNEDVVVQKSNEWLTLKLRYKEPKGFKSKLIEIPVAGKVADFDRASYDLRFSASVASFGMLLRDSEYAGNLTFSKVKDMAVNSKGNDEDGYRGEMIRLLKLAGNLKKELASAD